MNTATSRAGTASGLLQSRPSRLMRSRAPKAIEAGAASRLLAERHGAAEIREVRRQRDDWQRDATRQLATGRTGEAIRAYESAGMVHSAETREQARSALIERWHAERNDDLSR